MKREGSGRKDPERKKNAKKKEAEGYNIFLAGKEMEKGGT